MFPPRVGALAVTRFVCVLVSLGGAGCAPSLGMPRSFTWREQDNPNCPTIGTVTEQGVAQDSSGCEERAILYPERQLSPAQVARLVAALDRLRSLAPPRDPADGAPQPEPNLPPREIEYRLVERDGTERRWQFTVREGDDVPSVVDAIFEALSP